MLKKTSRPVNVPIPTIFKNNIDQFLHKNHPDKYNTNSTMNLNADQTLSQLSSSIDSIDGGNDLTSVQILDDDCMYLGKAQEYDIDGMDAYCLATNAEGPIQIYRNNDVEFMMEERLEEDEPSDDIYDEYDGDVKHNICDMIEKDVHCENVCRLCAETVPGGSEMVDLFTPTLSHSLHHINKLLPKQVCRDVECNGQILSFLLCLSSKLNFIRKAHIWRTQWMLRFFSVAKDCFSLISQRKNSFQFQIHQEDTLLPQRICLNCLSKLETFSQTLELFTAAQERFQQ